MKKIVSFMVLAVFAVSAWGAGRDALWKSVDEAVAKGLPQTAITNLEPIIAGALKDKAYAELAKALAQKIALEGNIQGNKPEEKITRLEEELAKAPAEVMPVFQTILAHYYWHYFQQNRWRFMQRTATAEAPGKDFTTWDLPRLFAEIDTHFQKALANENFLKRTPVESWNALLIKGTMPDTYRPTLYDFVAHEALQFYTSGEQAAAKAQDSFELNASSPVFGTTAEFLKWQVGDDGSPKTRAIVLYQKLLRFHEEDAEPRIAFAAVDLERLNWGFNTAFGEDKNTRYKAALKRFIEEQADFEVSAMAMEDLGRVLQQEGDLAAAREIALRGSKLFPDSPGGKLCRNLVLEIEQKQASIVTERVWNAPWPNITIRYRNVTNVYFRAIPYDWEAFLDKRRNRPENLSQKEKREILQKKTVLEWNEKLPPTTDYKERVFASWAPASLKPGFYFIAASHDASFGESENIVSLADVWVTELALVMRQRAGTHEGFVLHAESGEPIEGATVSVWHLDQNGNRVADPQLKTDANGFFSMAAGQPRGYLFLASHNGQKISTAQDIWLDNSMPVIRPMAQTVFFTDRAIYRPGQIIQYKGICLAVDHNKDTYEVLKGESLTVVFQDMNGKEIERQKVRANDYGSFSGSFTAPRDRVMGQMAIVAQDTGANGAISFNVEEYKRPKFEVTLEAPKAGTKLNSEVKLTGSALNYNGAPVDGAKVTYRVVRQVQWPWWWGGWWRRPHHSGESQEIAHGTSTTKADGSFDISFVAKPDPAVAEKDDPKFLFSITADITDSAGETRSSSQSVRVGYTALEATLSLISPWAVSQKEFQIRINASTLDSEPQVAEGSVKLYSLKAPERVHRLPIGGEDGDMDGLPDSDLSNPKNWPLDRVVAERGFTTGTNGQATLAFSVPVGEYRAVVETQDRFGKKVTGMLPVQVVDPEATHLAIKIPHLLTAPNWNDLQPGDQFLALWGTGYDTGRAFIEIEHQHKIIQRGWTKPDQTQQQIRVAVTEAMRGGFTVHVTQVRENRSFLVSRPVGVPWKNKQFQLTWERFVSKLKPGQKETWSLAIKPVANGKSAEKLAAEMVATLYDASLDAFAPRNWPPQFYVFHHDYSGVQAQFANMPKGFSHAYGRWGGGHVHVPITYRSFPPQLIQNFWGFQFMARSRYGLAARGGEPMVMMDAAPAPATAAPAEASEMMVNSLVDTSLARPMAKGQATALAATAAGGGAAEPKPDLSKVTARKNLNETAFFYPHLTADSNGVVRISFSMPEALTRWRFLGFAHDRALRSGLLEGETVTAKDLMIQPNPPRFLREGDTVEFTVKIMNQSDKEQSGTARLNFTEALTGASADRLLGNTRTEQSFKVPARESRTLAWKISVPDGAGFLTYKVVGATAELSDGEEGSIPVLSRRILVTESVALPIRGPGTKQFEFTKLLKSGSSKTLQHQNLSAQMVSNPAWYAVLALPYLMEFPHECSEQVFNRLYANSLARTIVNSDPKIKTVFAQWRNTPALDSPLEKNQDLKSVMLEETPWLRQAKDESQARRNVGILFEDNRLNSETERTLQKLAEMQLQDGAWPWFPGGPGNDYITLYITSGFGRLRQLGVDVPVDAAIRSLGRLDNWMKERYLRIQEGRKPEEYVPNSTDALYLYGRSFFLKDMAVSPENLKALEFFLSQSRKYWLETNNRQTQGHLAVALNRFAKANSKTDPIPTAITRSLKERSVSNEEMGMFWRDTELSWWWYHAPIETHALMIEVFDEVAQDKNAVEDLKVWLIKQKQTQDWKTTKATADAVYALLLRGRDLLASDALVELQLDGINVTPGNSAAKPGRSGKAPTPTAPVEAGTGFYEVRFAPAQIKPKLGNITVKKSDQGVAWGSVHWQYLEDMSKVTPHTGTPLKLKKSLYVKTNTGRGPTLNPVTGPVQVGDELVVRIELRTDRDMEYVHMKDQRGSGTEPVNVLSHYKYQDGLGYYESTRDTASHFFIDYLPKGVYVFEYSTRVQLRGSYQTGVAEIQCMYAPEFNSHSESIPLKVQ